MKIVIIIINSILSHLDNRFLAVILIIFLFNCICLTSKNVRKSFIKLIKIFLEPKFLLFIFIDLLYIILILCALYKLNFINIDYLQDIIIWFITISLPLIFNSSKITSEKNFFKNQIYVNFKASAFLGFLINSFPFNFFGEFILQIIIFFVIAFIAVSKTEKEFENMEKIFSITLIIITVILFGSTLYQIFINPNDFFQIKNLIRFILPTILTLLYFPFVYLESLFIMYENFYNVRLLNLEKKQQNQIKIRLFKKCNLNVFKLKEYINNFNNEFIDDRKYESNKIKKE